MYSFAISSALIARHLQREIATCNIMETKQCIQFVEQRCKVVNGLELVLVNHTRGQGRIPQLGTGFMPCPIVLVQVSAQSAIDFVELKDPVMEMVQHDLDYTSVSVVSGIKEKPEDEDERVHDQPLLGGLNRNH